MTHLRVARSIDPSSWVGLPGIPWGSRPSAQYLLSVVVSQAIVVAFAFVPSDASAHVAGLAIVPVGLAAWAFGRSAGLLVAGLNAPIVFLAEHSGVGWTVAAFDLLPILATAWFISDLSTLVSTRAKASRELARAHGVLAATLDGADRPIAQFDAQGRLGHANAAYLRAHGRRAEEIVGKTHAEAFGCSEHQALLDRVIASGEPIRETERPSPCMPRSGAEPSYWNYAIEPLEIGEGPAAIVTLEDVTERRRMRLAREAAEENVRRSESNFRQVAENTSAIIFLFSADLAQVHYVNAAYERITGYPVSELIDQPHIWLTRLSPEDQATIFDLLETKVLRGDPASTEVQIRTSAGAIRWGRINAFPVKGAAGTVDRIAGIVEDVTEHHLAFDAALRAKDQEHEIERLRAITEFKTSFLNTAAHELATPLTPLQFQLDAIQRGWVGDIKPEQKEAVDILARSTARLSLMIRDLLDAARLESGRLRLKLQDVDLRATVHEAAKSYELPANAAGIALRLHPGAPVPLRADPARIAQVVTNLVDNAVKYTPSGGAIDVEVALEAGRAVVRVRDTGRGFEPGQAERLFQPFMQVQPEGPYRGPGGTGIGLFISRGIVEAHGGKLWVVSEGPGKGSTFAFDLPLAQANGATGGPLPAQSPPDARAAVKTRTSASPLPVVPRLDIR